MRNYKDIRRNKNVKYIERFYGGIRFYWRIDGLKFLVIVTSDKGHDHVSISHKDKSITPTFLQMDKLRDLCFLPNEIVQCYMKDDGRDYIRSNCYHIFRKHSDPVLEIIGG